MIVCDICGRYPARRVAQGVRCIEHEGGPRKQEAKRAGDEPPLQPAREIDPATGGIPRKVQLAVEAARAGQWWWSLRHSISGDGKHFLSLRARRHGNRQQVVMIWEYAPPHWTPATRSREPRWVPEAEWINREAWTAPWRPATHTEVMRSLRS